MHDLLSALELGDDRNADSDDDENQDENRDGENDQSGAEGSPDSDAAQEMSADQAQASTDEMSESAMESAQASTSDTFDDGELGDDETPGEATRPNSRSANEPRGPEYHAFAPKFDEVIAAEDLCDHDELERLRSYLDKQLAHLQGIVARLANRLQRRLMAQQTIFIATNIDKITERTDAPLTDALTILMRERLTDLAPPKAAKKMVDL